MVWSGVAASCRFVGMYVAIDRASGVRNQKRAFALHQMSKTRVECGTSQTGFLTITVYLACIATRCNLRG